MILKPHRLRSHLAAAEHALAQCRRLRQTLLLQRHQLKFGLRGGNHLVEADMAPNYTPDISTGDIGKGEHM